LRFGAPAIQKTIKNHKGKVMESGLVQLLISLASGAAGGNIAGALMKEKSLGTVWNSVLGVVGGGLGSQLLGLIGLGDAGGIIGTIASSAVGGAALLAIVSFFKK
jgi:uncharacterized membrane protein YeaQ/YmgE (transglycosylase-associated protein family)